MSQNASPQSCQPTSEPLRRFNIRWSNGRYTVDIPEYSGGEVVDASAYDGLKARIEELEGTLREAANYIADFGFGDDYHSVSTLRKLRTALPKQEPGE